MSDKKAVIKNADMSEEMQQVQTLIIIVKNTRLALFQSWSSIGRILEGQYSRSLSWTGCSRLRNRSLGEVQCGEGHRSLHQEGDGQEVEDWFLCTILMNICGVFWWISLQLFMIFFQYFWWSILPDTIPRGTALWDATLALMWPMRQGGTKPANKCWKLILFRHFIYFYLGQVAILLFKSGWVLKSWLSLLSVLIFCDIVMYSECPKDPKLPLRQSCT